MYQIGLFFLVIIFLVFRSVALKRILRVKSKISGKSVYYLVISGMFIYCLPSWAIVFIVGFPLHLLVRHRKAIKALEASNLPPTALHYKEKLTELHTHRSSRTRLIRANAGVFLTLLILVEFVLALVGYQPGVVVYNYGFTPVDELVAYKGYEADQLGILHIDSKARRFNQKYIEKGQIDLKLAFYMKLVYDSCDYTAYAVGRDFLELRQGSLNTHFSQFASTLRAKKSFTEIERAYIDYLDSPINEDGFRSIAFKNHPTTRKKVLLLGDSFTWGIGTENLSSSFADELSCKGFAVYNSGITGVGMAQYAGIAETYAPIIQPDVVVVNVFLGNDIVEHRIDLKPNVPEYFRTNAGTLLTAPHGKYVYTAKDAYDRIIDQSLIPKQLSWVNWLSSQTRITTLIWESMKNMGLIRKPASKSAEEYWKFVNETKVGYQINYDRLAQIKATCDRIGCQMIVSIIPEDSDIQVSAAEVKKRLAGYPYVMISGLTAADYGNGHHFNDQGNRKYANFLAKRLNSIRVGSI